MRILQYVIEMLEDRQISVTSEQRERILTSTQESYVLPLDQCTLYVEVASKKKSELFSGTQPLHPDDIVVVLGKQTFAASVIRKLISSNRALQRQCFAMDEFVCNPTKHRLVPKHTRLMLHSAEDKQRFMNKHNIQSLQQLPLIFTTDPIAKWYGMQDGDICTVTRPTYTSHRMVVHNAE